MKALHDNGWNKSREDSARIWARWARGAVETDEGLLRANEGGEVLHPLDTREP